MKTELLLFYYTLLLVTLRLLYLLCHSFFSSLIPVLLCRLYRSLGDYDVVRGIFSGKIGTKSITFTALQAEAKSDYAEAVKLYNEVLCLGIYRS